MVVFRRTTSRELRQRLARAPRARADAARGARRVPRFGRCPATSASPRTPSGRATSARGRRAATRASGEGVALRAEARGAADDGAGGAARPAARDRDEGVRTSAVESVREPQWAFGSPARARPRTYNTAWNAVLWRREALVPLAAARQPDERDARARSSRTSCAFAARAASPAEARSGGRRRDRARLGAHRAERAHDARIATGRTASRSASPCRARSTRSPTRRATDAADRRSARPKPRTRG